MSGWWFASSATSATRFTKSIAGEVGEAELALEGVADLAPAVRHGMPRMARAGRLAAGSTIDAWSRPVPRSRARASSAPRRPSSCASTSSGRWRTSSCSSLLPLRVPPPAVVLASAATGLVAAVELAREQLVAAALLLQLKTVLDNADGQLARAAGKESRARALPRLGVRPARERGAVRGARVRDGPAVARARLVPRR